MITVRGRVHIAKAEAVGEQGVWSDRRDCSPSSAAYSLGDALQGLNLSVQFVARGHFAGALPVPGTISPGACRVSLHRAGAGAARAHASSLCVPPAVCFVTGPLSPQSRGTHTPWGHGVRAGGDLCDHWFSCAPHSHRAHTESRIPGLSPNPEKQDP